MQGRPGLTAQKTINQPEVAISYRFPALVNLQLYLHVKKNVHVKLHVNLWIKITFM